MNKIGFSKRIPGKIAEIHTECINENGFKIYKYNYILEDERDAVRFMTVQDFNSMFELKIPVTFY